MKTTTARLPSPVPDAALDAWTAHDWSHGVHLPDLDPHDHLIVRTRNSTYEFITTHVQTVSVLQTRDRAVM